MNEIMEKLLGAVVGNTYLATEIAFRLVDALVAKNVLTKGEAAETLEAIADGISADAAADAKATEMVLAVASTLKNSAKRYRS